MQQCLAKLACGYRWERRRIDLIARDTANARDADARAVDAQPTGRADPAIGDWATQLVRTVPAAIPRVAEALSVLAHAAVGAVRRARHDELTRRAFKAGVAVAHAVSADAMRVALLGAALDDRAVVAIEAREAQAAPAPAVPLRPTPIRARHLSLARIAGIPRLTDALPTLALAVLGALDALDVARAARRRRAVWPLPAGVAEADTI